MTTLPPYFSNVSRSTYQKSQAKEEKLKSSAPPSIVNTLPDNMFSEIAQYFKPENNVIISHFLSTCKTANQCTLDKMSLNRKNPVQNIFNQVTNRKVKELDLSYCDLRGVIVPETLPASLKALNLRYAKNIPPELMSRALASDSIEEINLSDCDLSILTDDDIPNPLPDTLKTLNLEWARNIPPQLIKSALASNIEELDLYGCDLSILTDDDIPNPLPASLKKLNLRHARNIPPALISRALASDSIEELALCGYDLSILTDDDIPNPLPASLKKLNLRQAINIPPELIFRIISFEMSLQSFI